MELNPAGVFLFFFFFKFVTVNNNVSTSLVAFFAFMIGNFILNKVVSKSYTALKVTRKI